MRVQGKQTQGPSWIWAVVGIVALIFVVQLFRNQPPSSNPLRDRFAAAPPASGSAGLSLPALPTGVVSRARTAVARLAGGQQVAPLTPVAQNAVLRVEISRLEPNERGLRVTGQAINISKLPLAIALPYFRFTDDEGTVYTTDTTDTSTLAPGQRAPLDLTLPIKEPKELTLDVVVPDQPTINMILIQGG